jgi:hypothetical protein
MSLPHQQSSNSGGVMPVQTSPLHPGASSQRESSAMYRAEQQSAQTQAIKTLSGGKRKAYRGGNGTVQVPSFSTPGPQVSPVGATQNSMQTNSTNLQSSANAACDKCIGDVSNTPTCQSPACNPLAGGGQSGGRRRRSHKSNKYHSKKSHKSRKSRKSRKSHKLKKSHKSRKSRKSRK